MAKVSRRLVLKLDLHGQDSLVKLQDDMCGRTHDMRAPRMNRVETELVRKMRDAPLGIVYIVILG
jgi:hypothetical protein